MKNQYIIVRIVIGSSTFFQEYVTIKSYGNMEGLNVHGVMQCVTMVLSVSMNVVMTSTVEVM